MLLHIFRPDRFGGGGRKSKEKTKYRKKKIRGRTAGKGFGAGGFCVFISDDGVSWLASVSHLLL